MAHSDHPYTYLGLTTAFYFESPLGASPQFLSTQKASKGFIQPCLSGLRTTFQSSEEGAAPQGNRECHSGRAGPTHRECAPAGAALCRLEAQNMLEHGKKGICLSDSDMFQHFPTGSCKSQNNCDSGSCSLAYDYICIMLQNSGQSGHTRTGAAGMHGPQWSSKLHRDSTRKKCGLTRSIQTTRRGPSQCPPFMGRGGGGLRPIKRRQLVHTQHSQEP